MQSHKRVTVLTGSLIALIIVIVVVYHFASTYLNRPACATTGTAHTVIIKDNIASPAHTKAVQCDTLTIINADPVSREIAFGAHDHHTAYNGITETNVAPRHELVITLVTPGDFHFHDHDDDTVGATFSVTRK